MFRTIWQYIRNDYARRRFGLDNADIQHIRADLRFRLALVEYAYFGRSGRKVASSLAELKSLLGDKAMHRYLGSLDPDLRTQFVERFQSRRRDAELSVQQQARSPASPSDATSVPVKATDGVARGARLGSNVVPINRLARPKPEQQTEQDSPDTDKPHSAESTE